MQVVCKGTARIKHKDTGVVYSISCDELDWEENGLGESPRGTRSEHRATLEHEELGTLSWYLWEYPVGAEDGKGKEADGHEVLRDFEYHLVHRGDE